MSTLGPKLAYTVDEAADLLSLSRAHLYRLMDIGEIGSISIGRSRRITQGQLESFIAQLEARSVQPLHMRINSCALPHEPATSRHGQKSR